MRRRHEGSECATKARTMIATQCNRAAKVINHSTADIIRPTHALNRALICLCILIFRHDSLPYLIVRKLELQAPRALIIQRLVRDFNFQSMSIPVIGSHRSIFIRMGDNDRYRSIKSSIEIL